MKKLFTYTLSLFAFWIFVFFFHRLFFILYQMPIGSKIKLQSDIFNSFIAGYKLDIATSVILLLLPLVLGILYYVFQKKYLPKIILFLLGFLLIVYAAVSLGDAGLYREWNAKINMQALDHFKNPSEVFKTLSVKLLVLFVLLLSLFFFPFFFLYRKKIHSILPTAYDVQLKKRILLGTIYLILSSGIAVILIRGGVTGIPMNQSIAYFSNDVLANDIAVNPLYNLMQDATIKTNIPDTSSYKFRTNQEAANIISDDFIVAKDSSIQILNTDKPNLVFIFLESWSTDNVSILGGVEGCTPKFDALSKEGLLFTKAYANAYVSDQGIPAVLSAYPSASRMAIINQPSKVHSIPCISEELTTQGYTSSFMFGGDLVYGNLRGYLLEKKFTELKEQKDFLKYPQGRLGVHDEFTFPELLKTLNQKKSPFLQGFFTTSTHMPYDYTPSDNWKSASNDPEKKYTESVHYSDIHLGKFFEEAKKQDWYKNTLFVVVADHSHNTIRQTQASSSEHSHIPLLFLGGALQNEWRGKTWNKIVSQLDIVSSLLHQMHIQSNHYQWSRDIFNPFTPSSAYYVFFGGSGYVNENGYTSSYVDNHELILKEVHDSTQVNKMHDKALSFQQLVYEDVRGK